MVFQRSEQQRHVGQGPVCVARPHDPAAGSFENAQLIPEKALPVSISVGGELWIETLV